MTAFTANPDDRPALARIAAAFGPDPASGGAWLARIAVLLYTAVLPFPHNAALKSLLLAAMLAALALALFERRVRLDLRSPLLVPLLTVMALALVSSAANAPAVENLDAYRKQFLPILLLVPLLLAHFRRREALLLLLGVAAASFGARSLLSLYDMLTSTREEAVFFKGFAMEASLYTPLVAGLTLAARGRWRAAAVAVLLLAAVAIVVNQSRTAIVAVTLGCLAIPLVLRYWRLTLLFVLAAATLVAGVLVAKPEAAARYRAALDASSYVGPEGMSKRYPIWVGVWRIAQEKPLLGHGFGWKKLGETAVRGGYVERWSQSDDPYLKEAAEYFSMPTDKVNPHSLPMQLLFEIGFLGLAAYLAMMAALFWQAARLARRAEPEWRPLAAAAFGFLVGYAIMCMSNGLWIGAGPSIMLLAALEACRQSVRKPS